MNVHDNLDNGNDLDNLGDGISRLQLPHSSTSTDFNLNFPSSDVGVIGGSTLKTPTITWAKLGNSDDPVSPQASPSRKFVFPSLRDLTTESRTNNQWTNPHVNHPVSPLLGDFIKKSSSVLGVYSLSATVTNPEHSVSGASALGGLQQGAGSVARGPAGQGLYSKPIVTTSLLRSAPDTPFTFGNSTRPGTGMNPIYSIDEKPGQSVPRRSHIYSNPAPPYSPLPTSTCSNSRDPAMEAPNVGVSNPLANYLLTQEMTRNVIRPFDGSAHQFWSWIHQVKARTKHLSLSPLDSPCIAVKFGGPSEQDDPGFYFIFRCGGRRGVPWCVERAGREVWITG